MAAAPEAKVKAAIKRYLIGVGAWLFMPVSNGMGAHGIPDIICCIGGFFLAIECKAPGKAGNTTALQKFQIGGIQLAGGQAIVATSVDDVRPVVELLLVKARVRRSVEVA